MGPKQMRRQHLKQHRKERKTDAKAQMSAGIHMQEAVVSSLNARKRTCVAHASCSLANDCLPCAINHCCTRSGSSARCGGRRGLFWDRSRGWRVNVCAPGPITTRRGGFCGGVCCQLAVRRAETGQLSTGEGLSEPHTGGPTLQAHKDGFAVHLRAEWYWFERLHPALFFRLPTVGWRMDSEPVRCPAW